MSALSRTHQYQTLLNDIAQLYTQARAGVVRMYWEIGRRIVEVEQQGEARAEYGEQLLPRLSEDLTKRFGVGFSLRNLHRMKAFYLQQKILPISAKLEWSHQVELLSVSDARLRRQLLKRAQQQGLSSQELRVLAQRARKRLAPRTSVNGTPATPPELLTPTRGTVGLFRIRDVGQRRCLDLGFESYRALTDAQAGRLEAGAIVRLAADGALHAQPEATPAQLFTYEARLERMIDGDTMWMLMHLGESEFRREKLRLRGIDCPELGTASGDAAKRYVQAQVARATKLVITTTKPDKWDRYLSDVFLTMPDGTEVFLNNRLLEQGHAQPYDAVSLADWETSIR